MDAEFIRWFKLQKDGLEELDKHVDRPDHYSDREGGFGKSVSGHMFRIGEPDVLKNRKHEHIRFHTQNMMNHTIELLRGEIFYLVVFVQPAKLVGVVRTTIHKRLRDRSIRIISGDYIHASASQIRKISLHAMLPAAV